MAHWWRSTLAGFWGLNCALHMLDRNGACRLLSGGWHAGYLQLPGGAGPWGLVDGECNEGAMWQAQASEKRSTS